MITALCDHAWILLDEQELPTHLSMIQVYEL